MMKLSQLITGTACLSAGLVHLVATAGSSEIVGVHKTTLVEGANSISAPLQGAATFKGKVLGVAGNVVTLATDGSSSPGFASSAFAPVTSGAVSLTQYVLMVRKDASASPGNQGDWFPISANSAGTVTVNPGSETLTTILAAGDEVEVRKLRNLNEILGSGASCILTKDNDFDETAGNDLVRTLLGTSFQASIFYHDGSQGDEGYYVDGEFFGDGSTVTIAPDEPILVFREAGSGSATRGSAGRVQSFALTHYLNAGSTAVASGFPVDAPIGTSGLVESGFVKDSDLDETIGNDLLRNLVGTSFLESVFYHDGSQDVAGWYVDGSLNNTWPLPPAGGVILFTASETKWRQEVPFRN